MKTKRDMDKDCLKKADGEMSSVERGGPKGRGVMDKRQQDRPECGPAACGGTDRKETKAKEREQGDGADKVSMRPGGQTRGQGQAGTAQGELGVGMEWDLDAVAHYGGLRREVVTAAFDAVELRMGEQYEVDHGRVKMTWEGVERVMRNCGHRFQPQDLIAARTPGKRDPGWNRRGFVRVRVNNPFAGKRVVLGYRMDTGEGVRCLVPDATKFVLGMHLVVQKTTLASQPDLYELAEPPPRAKGRW